MLKEAADQGFEVGQTRNGHIKVLSPSGKQIISSGTPSDFRGFYNMRAELRRAGLNRHVSSR
jgi:hypothetical protein